MNEDSGKNQDIVVMMELTYSDERAFRELAFKWALAWEKKVVNRLR